MNALTFKLAGDGYWGAEAGREVTLTDFTVEYMDPKTYDVVDEGTPGAVIGHVSVFHNSTWDVYTDSAFSEAAANFTNIMGLGFTEQGMQEDGIASMEV
jgi:hypothetical protein